MIMQPDVVLIGSGIMSATLAVLLKRLEPRLRIQMIEVTSELAREASDGWNNAGTGHAGICELSYTPTRESDGSVPIERALRIFEQFEHSKQFWGSLVANDLVGDPRDFIQSVPHVCFMNGADGVSFLQARHVAMQKHHFFSGMKLTNDPTEIRQWAPLVMEGRAPGPVAATTGDGTEVNYGLLARRMCEWLSKQENCEILSGWKVTKLQRNREGWQIAMQCQSSREVRLQTAPFVFVGAGGGSVPLLQSTGLREFRGLGGFPIAGQWLVCDEPAICSRHHAKVYGATPPSAPSLGAAHLDIRLLNGSGSRSKTDSNVERSTAWVDHGSGSTHDPSWIAERSTTLGRRQLLFGPFASWTTRFLKQTGSWRDLPRSFRMNNVASLLRAGVHNRSLVKYLIAQGLQSMNHRIKALQEFFPNANANDWRLVEAGIRVQTIKAADRGAVYFGTEVVSSDDLSLAALLGASPGASVAVSIALDVVRKCKPQLLAHADGHQRMKQLIPTYDQDIKRPENAEIFRAATREAAQRLRLDRSGVDLSGSLNPVHQPTSYGAT